jgi:DNA-binding MarR family transcriptional regulator
MTETVRGAARHMLGTMPQVIQRMTSDLRHAGHCFAMPHFRALMLLSRPPHTLSELAESQGVSLPTMSKTVSTLCGRGWVAREADEDDRRKTALHLTAEGEAVLKDMRCRAEQAFVDLLSPLSEEQLARLVDGLAVLDEVVGGTPHPVPGADCPEPEPAE